MTYLGWGVPEHTYHTSPLLHSVPSPLLSTNQSSSATPHHHSTPNMSSNNNSNNNKNGEEKPLRQLAAEKLHGEGANPSMLGDPTSLKAETSDYDADPQGHQNEQDRGTPQQTRKAPASSGGGSRGEKILRGDDHRVSGMMTEDIRQGKVGPPSSTLEGDATSLTAERSVTSSKVDRDDGEGMGRGLGGATRGKGKGAKL